MANINRCTLVIVTGASGIRNPLAGESAKDELDLFVALGPVSDLVQALGAMRKLREEQR